MAKTKKKKRLSQ